MTELQFRSMLESLKFDHYFKDDTYTKLYGDSACSLVADFKNREFRWPSGLTVTTSTTSNFSQAENFVVFECVHRLLEMGYQPKDIELEPRWKLGHGSSGGRADIWVRTKKPGEDSFDSLLIIECKTFGSKFNAAWKDTTEDGDQLFGYFAQEPSTKFLCLYASDYSNDKYDSVYHLINVQDNEEYLKTLKSPASFEKGKTKGRRELFKAWKETYKLDFATIGLFEEGIAAYHPGKSDYTIDDLKTVDAVEIGKMYHRFAETLRKYNVSGRENAFDKLVNLMLAKVVDELQNDKKLLFNWKGAAYDDDFRLQDRLQRLYKEGMQKFLGEDVTYIDDKQIDQAFRRFKNDPDATRDTVRKFVRQLKFFTNNDFAFIDVHNEKLFDQNAIVLREVVRMLQDIRLRTDSENQFLGDLFENFLDQGVKQSEGQFFTPIPFVRFMVNSLPIAEMIEQMSEPPIVLDYACGAGHFLNEYARQAAACVKARLVEKAAKKKGGKIPDDLYPYFAPYFDKVFGIEKEYRLSKVSKVASFMYGQDDIHIIYADALIKNDHVKDGTVNFLLTNPPYSVKGFLETLSEEQRKQFRLADCVDNISKNDDIECFFIERAAQLLAPGGMAAIVLPSSILNNGNIYVKCRDILLESFDIVAIVEMGNGTFGKTNTSTATLFLRRKQSDPDPAKHVCNRVMAWFNGDFSGDAVYGGAEIRAKYANIIGVSKSDYDEFLKGSKPKALMESEVFAAYVELFESSTKANAIKKKKLKKGFSADDRQKELEDYIFSEIRAVESEKLRVFMLAEDNPQPVVVVKSPSKTKQVKKFLGYEWSTTKGKEGMHVLGAETKASDDFKGNRGMDQIITPLFNPQHIDDPTKICWLIRQNYLRNELELSDEISATTQICFLDEMIDFRSIDFNKKLLAGRTNFISRWAHFKNKVTLKQVAPFSQKRKKIKSINLSSYISTDNMLQDREGVVTYEGDPQIDSVVGYDKGDVLVSNIRPYLKKIWLADKAGGCSPDVLVFHPDSDQILPEILFIFLSDDDFFDFMMSGNAGLKMPRGDKKKIPSYEIPELPLPIQKEIVAKCARIDNKVKKAKEEIGKYIKQKESAFEGMKGKKTVKFAALCKSINPAKTEVADKPDGVIVSFVDMSSVSNEGYIVEKDVRPIGSVRKGGYTYFAEGDVIVAKITPCMENGKCALATGLENGIGFGSSEFHVFRAKDDVSNAFVFYYLNRSTIRKAAERVMTGSSGHKRVPIEFYENLDVPNLSFAEQNKIAAKIKELDIKIAALKKVIAECRVEKANVVEAFLK